MDGQLPLTFVNIFVVHNKIYDIDRKKTYSNSNWDIASMFNIDERMFINSSFVSSCDILCVGSTLKIMEKFIYLSSISLGMRV